jgi:hypothetical protein
VCYFLATDGLDLLRESGEFPMSDEELDDTATMVYEGICGRSGPPSTSEARFSSKKPPLNEAMPLH